MESAELPDEGFSWHDHPLDVRFNSRRSEWEATSRDWPELRVVDGEAYRAIVLLRNAIRDEWRKRHAGGRASSSAGREPQPFIYRVTVTYNPTESTYKAASPDIPEMHAIDRHPGVAKEKLQDWMRLLLARYRREGINIPQGMVPMLRPWPVIRRWLGACIPDGMPGYTLEDAIESVGPGWSGLVTAAHRRLTKAECRIVQVKEKFGGLRVYFDPPDTTEMSEEPRRWLAVLNRWERWIERRSFTVCEGCGARGGRVVRGRYVRTLCATCAWRWLEGADEWSKIRAAWSPDAPRSD
jgi:predicted RNase H-like HicB family nuclease